MFDVDPAGLAALIAVNLWIAWRYSALPVSQDEGLWMLWGFTGSRPYLDHVDCKPPGVHLWLKLLAMVTRRRVRPCKFLHHLSLGAFGIVVYRLSGDLNAAAAFTLLVHSAWLEGYYAWVEALSSGFLLLAFYLQPGAAVPCVFAALLFNLKLALPGLLLVVARGWWAPLAVVSGLAVLALAFLFMTQPALLRDLWYGVGIVGRRMERWRKDNGQGILPRWDRRFATPLLLVLPLAFSARQPEVYTVAGPMAAAYVIVNSLGRVWRPYHWIPFAALIAPASPAAAIPFLLADLITNGLYLGDIIGRHRPEAARYLRSARRVGLLLREPGVLWVHGEFTQLYIYARKRPVLLPVEQVEIRHVIPERRQAADAGGSRVDTIVICPGELRVAPEGFRTVATDDRFLVLRHEPEGHG